MRSLTILMAALISFSILLFVYATPVQVSLQIAQAVQGLRIVVYYETAPAAGCTTPNMQTTPPTTSGKSHLLPVSSLCLWSPAYTSATTFSGGVCTLVLYAIGVGSISFTVYVTNSMGGIVTTVGSSSIPVGAFYATEYVSRFTCSQFTVPPGGYIMIQLTTNFLDLVYFGPSSPTDFQVVQSAAGI
ncbi:MAG: hypothetical protein QW514_04030 [Thermoprotei archaeon]